jgi:tRNA (cytidine/uridine-2'-O-)-methyltransferase
MLIFDMRIALFEPDIPQNTGNIFRLGGCLGIPIDIIEPTGYLFDDKRFQRSSMDYIKHTEYKRHLDWESFYKWSKENNYRLILLTTKSQNKYINYKFQSNDILLFGRESAGVTPSVHESVNEQLTIPMVKGLRSINVSSAVALVVGEACRQLNLL